MNCRMLLADHFQFDKASKLVIAGDAAHLNPPWGGHGYNTCVGDAVNVAWKLAACINGWAGPHLLASYEPERRPVAARTIADATANNNALAHHFADDLRGQDGPGGDQARSRTAEALQVKDSESHSWDWSWATTTQAHLWLPTTAHPSHLTTPSHTCRAPTPDACCRTSGFGTAARSMTS